MIATVAQRLRSPRGERGSSLILALGFLSLFGTFIGVLLNFTDSNLRITSALRVQRADQYAADAGVEKVITRLIPVQTPCPAPQTYTDVNGVSVGVTCAPMPAVPDHRQVRLVASVDGKDRLTAVIIFHDENIPNGTVEVNTWSVA